MKIINPEGSCVLDVGERRAHELKNHGWKPYTEPTTAPKAKAKAAEENKEAKPKTPKKKTSKK